MTARLISSSSAFGASSKNRRLYENHHHCFTRPDLDLRASGEYVDAAT